MRNIETIWILTNGNRGNEVICEGVASALGGTARAFIIDRTWWAELTAPYWPARLTARYDRRWQAPWPDIVLASSRLAYPAACHIRAAAKGQTFCVALQDPVISPRHFDLVWAPLHDQLSGANVVSTLLSPHAITQERIDAEKAQWGHLRPHRERRCVGVLIGGPNPAYPYRSDECHTLITQLQALMAQDTDVIVTTSRRTPDWLSAMIRTHLSAAQIIEPSDQNPYPAMLGLVDAIIVTPDSVNMTGEACVAGRPVYRADFAAQRPSKFDQFHTLLTEAGLVLPFKGHIDTQPRPARNDTEVIAKAIRDRFLAAQKS